MDGPNFIVSRREESKPGLGGMLTFSLPPLTWVWGSLAKGGGQRPWLLVLLVFLKKSPLRISHVLFTGQTFLKTVNW